MARTKRKANPVKPAPVQEASRQRIYQTGGYIRLSVEDSGKPGAETIENQKEMVRGYIENQPDMELYGMYCDNGQTGTDFERPEFERLMQDVRAGKVDCFVAKNLSRFGRNYRETGNYLERIFPFLGIRFVAVSDHFDTLGAERGSDGYIIPLKNIINEVYSKDISRKSGSALAVKQRNGEFIGTWAAYGYQKRADDPHRIEPDAETAPVVQMIFGWRASGMSYTKITRQLNGAGIPSPSRYHYLKGDAVCGRYADAVWRTPMVKKILSNEVYLGHMVQGRKRGSFYEGKKQQKIPKSDWVIVRNTHEPIVDEGVFLKVQKMAQEQKAAYQENLGKYDGLGKTENILRGLVFCADCKRPLVRYKSVYRKGAKVNYSYICPSHMDNPDSCPNKRVPEKEMLEILWDVLKNQVKLAEKMTEQIHQSHVLAQTASRDIAIKQEEDAAIQALKRAQMLYDSLYPMYAEDKVLTEQEYLQMKQTYQIQIHKAEGSLEAVRAEKQSFLLQEKKNPWLEACMGFTEEASLTAEMAKALISRVEVGEYNRLTVTLCYQDEYKCLAEFLNEAGKERPA